MPEGNIGSLSEREFVGVDLRGLSIIHQPGKAFQQRHLFSGFSNQIFLSQTEDTTKNNLLNTFRSIFPPPAITDLDYAGHREIQRSKNSITVYLGGSLDCFGARHVKYLRFATDESRFASEWYCYAGSDMVG